MKVKGNRQNGVIPGTVTGEPAHFAIKLGEQSRFEMPVSADSWTEEFQAGEDGMMEEEDTPGFTLVAASAALGMAFFVNQRRQDDLTQ